MANQTPEDYYSEPENFGASQYVSLKDVIDSMLLEAQDDDSFIKNVRRAKLIKLSKDAIRLVNRQASNKIFAIEVTVPDTLFFPIPQDYLNYARVSVVVTDRTSNSFRLQPLDVNYGINTATGYLQDNDGDLLFDQDGNILTSDSSNGYARPYKTYQFSSGYQPMVNASKFSKYGEFKPDTERGQFLFSSDLMDKEIVIEYISDGLPLGVAEDEILIHKFLRETIENWVYFGCIERSRNVPANEKQRALNRFKTTLHQSKMAMADLDILRIARSMRGNTMTL